MENRHRTASHTRRALLFIGLVTAGAVIGVVGRSLTAHDAWFLAIPLCVAIGWLFVATPDKCGGAACATDSNHQKH